MVTRPGPTVSKSLGLAVTLSETLKGHSPNVEPAFLEIPRENLKDGFDGYGVAVIIPALEEGNTVLDVISQVKSAAPAANIVVVDGGSLDGTSEKAERAEATVIVERRRGYGRAIRTGIESVDADFYAMVDADDTYDLTSLPRMVQLAQTGRVVIGSRVGSSGEAMSLSHKMGNRVLSLVYKGLFHRSIADTQSGFKVFPARIGQLLHENGMTLSSEILVIANAMQIEPLEVPIRYQPRHSQSQSKFSFWRDGLTVLGFLLKSRWRIRTERRRHLSKRDERSEC